MANYYCTGPKAFRGSACVYRVHRADISHNAYAGPTTTASRTTAVGGGVLTALATTAVPVGLAAPEGTTPAIVAEAAE